ncbi:MAG TPA: hypothetical protein VH394_20120 [Thermoanaerobaculia bacterium]|jgi:hypothetical protein|nr:hypothetical protein [Thermoanaerobaculia bacterium]
MSEPKGKFTIRLSSALSLDRIYRVYLDNAAAYFINLGSPSGVARALGRQFGVIGRMLAESYERKQAVKRAEVAAELDREHPGILLSRDKANFSLPFIQIESAVVEPAALFGGHGPHVGRLTVRKRDGKDLRFQFEDMEEMKAAVTGLQALLGERLRLKVRWDDRKGEYVKAA